MKRTFLLLIVLVTAALYGFSLRVEAQECDDRCQMIQRLYQEVLGREADSGGLQYFYENGGTEDQIRKNLCDSSEGRSLGKPRQGCPGEQDRLIEYGMNLALSGDIEGGVKAIYKAIQLNTTVVKPFWSMGIMLRDDGLKYSRYLEKSVEWFNAGLARIDNDNTLDAQAKEETRSQMTSDLAKIEAILYERTVAEERMLELINQERLGAGLHPLIRDPLMGTVARSHSLDMLRREYFDHQSPEGTLPWDRMRKAGVVFKDCCSENLGRETTVELVHQGLMNSPGHRDNILTPKWNRVGIGAAWGLHVTGLIIDDGGTVSPTGWYGWMFTQNFAVADTTTLVPGLNAPAPDFALSFVDKRGPVLIAGKQHFRLSFEMQGIEADKVFPGGFPRQALTGLPGNFCCYSVPGKPQILDVILAVDEPPGTYEVTLTLPNGQQASASFLHSP